MQLERLSHSDLKRKYVLRKLGLLTSKKQTQTLERQLLEKILSEGSV